MSKLVAGGVLILLMLSASRVLAQGEASQDKLNLDLHYAIINEDKLAVRDLLRQGADANAMDSRGDCPLRTAAEKGSLDICKLLVEAGADVNASHPRQRESILTEAASDRFSSGKSAEVVCYLLSKGAAPEPQALESACKQGLWEVAKLLIEAGVPPEQGLGAAAQGGHVEVVQLLLNAGAPADGSGDFPPISLAAHQGSAATVEVLLKAGANPNAVDELGSTPLHHAVTGFASAGYAANGNASVRIVELLVEAGAQIDVANREGVTPVRMASISGAVDVYDWLLARSGGKEPAPSNIEDDKTVDTDQLLSVLLTGDEATRATAQRSLVARGDRIIPSVLKVAAADGFSGPIANLLAAMGPQGQAALPYLDTLLDDMEQAPMVLVTLNRMDPRSIERLPMASKERAAEALFKGIHSHTQDSYGPYLMRMLIGLGEVSTPQLLRFLGSDNPGLRAGAARQLQHATFDSPVIGEKLVNILLHDPHPRVRVDAAGGLQNPHFHSDEAKLSLITLLATPSAPKNAAAGGGGEVLAKASWALAAYGQSIIPEVRDRLAEADEVIRANYCDVFDRLGENPENVESFTKLLDDPNSEVRESAHRQMARLAADHSDEAGDLLVRRFSEGDSEVQVEAAKTITRIGRGRKASRFLPIQLSIVADDRFDRPLRMSALGSAMNLDINAVKKSPQAKAFVEVLLDEIENGEYSSQLQAMTLVAELGSTAAAATPLLESLIAKPLPERPDTIPDSFRPGIDDQPSSTYREYMDERGAAESIRRQAKASLRAIQVDVMK